MAENQTIQITGAPVITNLSGLFYLSNPTQTGYNRIWRNQGPSVIYYQPADPDNVSIIPGWKLADIITGTVYFSESVAAAANPWDVTAWTSTAYADHLGTLRVLNSNEPQWVENGPTTSTSEPKYDFTTDSTFHATKKYYYEKNGNKYLVRQIVLGNKIDPDTFYEKQSNEDEEGFITTDQYFVSFEGTGKQYYTKVNGVLIPTVYIESAIPAETYYNQIGDETVTTSSKIDQLTGTVITGSTHTVSNIKEIEIEVHTRECAPKVEVGQVYRFSFLNDFRYLGYLPPTSQDFKLEGRYDDDTKGENDSDITRGIFRVENITTYYNLVLSGVDIYQNLYLPLNLTPELFEADRKKWMNDDVWYKLVDPTIETRVLYVPIGIIDGIPDGNVTEYNRYHLIIDIGIFGDSDLLTDVVTDINMLMRAKFGIPSSAQLASYDKLYIPDEYYDWLNKVRKQYAKNFMQENGNQYYETLFSDEYNALHKENLELQGKVDTYEKLLSEVSTNG